MVMVLVLLPILYVLSIGPVAMAFRHTGIRYYGLFFIHLPPSALMPNGTVECVTFFEPPRPILIMYAPIQWVYVNALWTRKPLNAYCRLWGCP